MQRKLYFRDFSSNPTKWSIFLHSGSCQRFAKSKSLKTNERERVTRGRGERGREGERERGERERGIFIERDGERERVKQSQNKTIVNENK